MVQGQSYLQLRLRKILVFHWGKRRRNRQDLLQLGYQGLHQVRLQAVLLQVLQQLALRQLGQRCLSRQKSRRLASCYREGLDQVHCLPQVHCLAQAG